MGLFSESEPESRMVRGKPLRCVVCSNSRFYRRTAQLNTAVASFFDFDWVNPSGTCYICSECGYIHWFLLQHD